MHKDSSWRGQACRSERVGPLPCSSWSSRPADISGALCMQAIGRKGCVAQQPEGCTIFWRSQPWALLSNLQETCSTQWGVAWPKDLISTTNNYHKDVGIFFFTLGGCSVLVFSRTMLFELSDAVVFLLEPDTHWATRLGLEPSWTPACSFLGL